MVDSQPPLKKFEIEKLNSYLIGKMSKTGIFSSYFAEEATHEDEILPFDRKTCCSFYSAVTYICSGPLTEVSTKYTFQLR
jgi:hypothetical protein